MAYSDIGCLGSEILTPNLDSLDFDPPENSFFKTDAISYNALTFLKSEAEKGKPFFLYFPYTAPHWPLHALPEDIAKYRYKYLKGWDVIREENEAYLTSREGEAYVLFFTNGGEVGLDLYQSGTIFIFCGIMICFIPLS